VIEPSISEALRFAGRRRWLAPGGLLAAGLMAGFFTSSTASAAVVLPAASSLVDCVRNHPDTTLLDPSSCSIPNAAQASVSTAPFVELQTEARELAGDPGPNSSFARLGYTFEIVGGAPGAEVPLLFSTVLFTSAASPDLALARITVGNLGGPQFSGPSFHATEVACSGSPDACAIQNAPNSGFSGTFGITGVDGVVGTVNLVLEAGVGSVGGTAIATADPFIFIDPTFADAGEFRIVLSDGVVNGLPPASGAPEPAAWAMLIAGFGMVGSTLRRRRRCAA
jgi:hypothetical protein